MTPTATGTCPYCKQIAWSTQILITAPEGAFVAHASCYQANRIPTLHSLDMARKKGRHKAQKAHQRKMHSSQISQDEQDLIDQVKALNVELPHEFKAWSLYYFTRANYMLEMSNYIDAKLQGVSRKIETDMTPHRSSTRQQNSYRGGWGDEDYWGAEYYATGHGAASLVKKPPVIAAPSGTLAEEHIVF